MLIGRRGIKLADKLSKSSERYVLFLDQAGEMGGAQMCLFDIAVAYPRDAATVLLFSDGPFRNQLSDNAVNVLIANGANSFVKVPRGTNLFGMLKGLAGLFRASIEAIKLAKNHRVIYANSQKALLVGAFAARFSGRPLIWHLHDILTVDDTSKVVRWIARTLANKFCDVVIINSRATGRAFRDIGGETRTCLIYNGIRSTDFGPHVQAEQLPPGVIPGSPIVGVFGRLSAWKGQRVAIDMLEHVWPLHLLLVGGPLFGQKKYERELLDYAVARGLQGRVHFIGQHPNVGGWMRACDLIMHSSTLPEPFGRVIVEGMLSGRPVIATNAGGVPEIIDDDETGYLIPPGDSYAMALAVKRLLKNPVKAQAMAIAGREAAIQRFSLESFVANVQSLVAQIAERRVF